LRRIECSHEGSAEGGDGRARLGDARRWYRAKGAAVLTLMMDLHTLGAFSLEPDSPAIYLLVGAVFLACSYLGWRVGRRRASRRKDSEPRGPSQGVRILVKVGATVIAGIWFLAPGGTSSGRMLFLFGVLPLAAIWIFGDVQHSDDGRTNVP
jgi:hypothetical protein